MGFFQEDRYISYSIRYVVTMHVSNLNAIARLLVLFNQWRLTEYLIFRIKKKEKQY